MQVSVTTDHSSSDKGNSINAEITLNYGSQTCTPGILAPSKRVLWGRLFSIAEASVIDHAAVFYHKMLRY